jgi:hypothetical protein
MSGTTDVAGAFNSQGPASIHSQRSQELVERVLVSEVKPGLSEPSVTHVHDYHGVPRVGSAPGLRRDSEQLHDVVIRA